MTTSPNERDWLPDCWSATARSMVSASFSERVRPWNWLELDRDDASTLWRLLVDFVSYFNARYGCRIDRKIPPCWAEHGPLVEEITTLMLARWQAFESEHASVGGAQFWHSYTLPSFYVRMADWLGDDGVRCLQGGHVDRDADRSEPETWQRRTDFLAETDATLRGEERICEQRMTVPFLKQLRIQAH